MYSSEQTEKPPWAPTSFLATRASHPYLSIPLESPSGIPSGALNMVVMGGHGHSQALSTLRESELGGKTREKALPSSPGRQGFPWLLPPRCLSRAYL